MAEHWEHKTLTLEQPTNSGDLVVKLVNGKPPEQAESARTLAQWLDELTKDTFELQTIIPGNQFAGQVNYHPTMIFRRLVP
jgi:hypothetical protein